VGGGGGEGGNGCAVRLYRSEGGAYDAAQLAAVQLAAVDKSQDPADRSEDLDGPASIVMCQVLASPTAAAAWERIAPRRNPAPPPSSPRSSRCTTSARNTSFTSSGPPLRRRGPR